VNVWCGVRQNKATPAGVQVGVACGAGSKPRKCVSKRASQKRGTKTTQARVAGKRVYRRGVYNGKIAYGSAGTGTRYNASVTAMCRNAEGREGVGGGVHVRNAAWQKALVEVGSARRQR